MQERTPYANDFLPPAADTAQSHAVVAPALYQAALGPLSAAHYLAAFDRLDTAGRVLPGWNWAAALCTPGWLVFHRLWRFALLYLVALVMAGLLLWGVGHVWLALPLPMTAGLALALGLVAFGVPGLYGDAFLHAQLQQRIRQAVSAAPNLREARDLLEQQAGSQRRLMAVAAGGLVLALFVTLVWAWLAGGLGRYASSLQADQLVQRPPAAAVQLPAASAVSQSPPQPQLLPMPVSPAPDATASSPSPLPSPSPQPQASAPTPAGDVPVAITAPAVPGSSDAAAPGRPAASAALAQAAASAPSASASGVAAEKAPATAVATVPATAPAAVAEKAPEKATPKTSDAAPAAPAASTPTRARAAVPAKNAAQSRGKAASAQDSARQLYINVGLFANPANARRAHARLTEAGLPATVSEVRVDGRRLQRVRVGPFTSAAQANAAVEQVLALGLDARPAAE